MKAIFIIIVFLFHFLLPLKSSDTVIEKTTTLQQQNFNHQTFGLYQNMGFGITGGVKKFDSYATNFQTNTGYRYKYEIYVYSRTVNQYNQNRNTNVYGLHVFVNNKNITIAQYPYGLNFIATLNGIMVYVWETNSPTPNFGITWQTLQ